MLYFLADISNLLRQVSSVLLTVAVQRKNVPGLEDFDEETVVVEVDANGQDPEERRVCHVKLLLFQPLQVVHVNQAVRTPLEKKIFQIKF